MTLGEAASSEKSVAHWASSKLKPGNVVCSDCTGEDDRETLPFSRARHKNVNQDGGATIGPPGRRPAVICRDLLPGLTSSLQIGACRRGVQADMACQVRGGADVDIALSSVKNALPAALMYFRIACSSLRPMPSSILGSMAPRRISPTARVSPDEMRSADLPYRDKSFVPQDEIAMSSNSSPFMTSVDRQHEE